MNLLCGHPDQSSVVRGHRALCTVCESFADVEYQNSVRYDSSYPTERNHFDPVVGSLKAETILAWINNQIDLPRQSRVFEIGFGGGFPLTALERAGFVTYGIEADNAHVEHASSLGLSDSRLYTTDTRPLRLREKIDLWIFSDSFEHLSNPSELIDWISANSTDNARVLLVLPRADSLSQRLLGKMWMHRLPDHSFHWSKEGLISFWKARGFHLESSFHPAKDVDLGILGRHLKLKVGLNPVPHFLSRISLRFNIGEMGLVLRRSS